MLYAEKAYNIENLGRPGESRVTLFSHAPWGAVTDKVSLFCTERADGLQSHLPEFCTARDARPAQDPGEDADHHLAVRHQALQAEGDRGGDQDHNKVCSRH